MLREPPICTNDIQIYKTKLGQENVFTFNFIDPLVLNSQKSSLLIPKGLKISMIQNELVYLSLKETNYDKGIGYGEISL